MDEIDFSRFHLKILCKVPTFISHILVQLEYLFANSLQYGVLDNLFEGQNENLIECHIQN